MSRPLDVLASLPGGGARWPSRFARPPGSLPRRPRPRRHPVPMRGRCHGATARPGRSGNSWPKSSAGPLPGRLAVAIGQPGRSAATAGRRGSPGPAGRPAAAAADKIGNGSPGPPGVSLQVPGIRPAIKPTMLPIPRTPSDTRGHPREPRNPRRRASGRPRTALQGPRSPPTASEWGCWRPILARLGGPGHPTVARARPLTPLCAAFGIAAGQAAYERSVRPD